jgi:antitoxin (DNA-binding transcriptional repressor) of toxin-antitoxin stability system
MNIVALQGSRVTSTLMLVQAGNETVNFGASPSRSTFSLTIIGQLSNKCRTYLSKEFSVTDLSELRDQPLGRLLQGVSADVFTKAPATIGLRDLQRDMSSLLQKMLSNHEYRVLTNRGAPSFLLIPLDPTAWTTLLAAAPPQTAYEVEKAHKREQGGEVLPDTDTVLARMRESSKS